MPPLDHHLLEIAADPDRALRLVAALRGPLGGHLDDEGFAAMLEDAPPVPALAHLLRCAACAERGAILEDVLGVIPFPARDNDGSLPVIDPERALLFASLVTHPDGDVEIVECTGAARVQGALALRADAGVRTVSLRDRRESPRLEISLLSGANPRRVSLLVRWLAEHGERLSARAFTDGRIVAETEFSGRGALLGSLRRRDLRIDVCGPDRILGSAWLRMESP